MFDSRRLFVCLFVGFVRFAYRVLPGFVGTSGATREKKKCHTAAGVLCCRVSAFDRLCRRLCPRSGRFCFVRFVVSFVFCFCFVLLAFFVAFVVVSAPDFVSSRSTGTGLSFSVEEDSGLLLICFVSFFLFRFGCFQLEHDGGGGPIAAVFFGKKKKKRGEPQGNEKKRTRWSNPQRQNTTIIERERERDFPIFRESSIAVDQESTNGPPM